VKKPDDNLGSVGVLGAGTMGTGIAQVAATHGRDVMLFDADHRALSASRENLTRALARQVEKRRLEEKAATEILQRIQPAGGLGDFAQCDCVIEAISEDLDAKKTAFRNLEAVVPSRAVLATNTSSLSITAIAAACKNPERVLGLHFFNPAPVMALVEVVPGLATSQETVERGSALVRTWGKTTVVASDTPGFIVNRVARPFYGEALQILEEGMADVATIDWAMRELGGFRMGPFELMDLIGNDVNYKVTETIFASLYFDPRYKPSVTQKRLVEAGRLGRKSGRGFFDYRPNAVAPEPDKQPKLGEEIFLRIIVMLVNEAADVVFHRVATVQDVDLAMTLGANYPKGPLRWADELGLDTVLARLAALQEEYGDDRYRPSPLLKRLVRSHRRFYERTGS
jgi:3-hydroxybutyryl-CoA dehydrogenase